jgi:hypothetical protein
VETILESNSDAHSSQDEDISPHSDSYTNDITETNCTQWTIQTVNLLYTTCLHGVPMGYEKNATHIIKDYCTEVLHALLFEIIQLMM